jgi:hypothetical protein
MRINVDDTGQVSLIRVSGVTPCNRRVDGAVFICASEWTKGDPIYDSFFQRPDGSSVLWPFFDRFRQAKKSLPASNDDNGDRLGDSDRPEQLRPYRDQTVFYGMLTTRGAVNDEWPHINYPSSRLRDFHTFACTANDGDLDVRMQVDVTRIPRDFFNSGWEVYPYNHKIDILPKLLNVGLFDQDAGNALHLFTPGRWSYIGVEGIMYGGDTVKGCPQSSSMVLPGWADTGGNSILVNGRPIEGYAFPNNVMPSTPANPPVCPTCDPLSNAQTPLAGLNGYPLTAATETRGGDPLTTGTEVRVTGALILDCGHGLPFYSGDDESYDPPSATLGAYVKTCDEGEGWEDGETPRNQNQEIHTVYSMDLIECPLGIYPPCASMKARSNLTGAWGSEDGGTYYVRQIGNTIWMLGLTRNRDPIMPEAPYCEPPGASADYCNAWNSEPIPQIPNPTSVFLGTITEHTDGSAVITGQAVTLPKGAETGGLVTHASFTVNSNRKHFDVTSSSSPFPLPSHFDKLYEQPPDTTSPRTTAALGPYTAVTWTTQAVTVTLTCDDGAGSGCELTQYNLDGSGWKSYSAPLTIANEGKHVLQYRSTDSAGNVESAKSVAIWIDRTPPRTVLAPRPHLLNGRPLASGTATVTVSPGTTSYTAVCLDSYGLNAALFATDNLSGVGVIGYGSAKMTAGQPLPRTPLTGGLRSGRGIVQFINGGGYVFAYAAVDRGGNREPVHTHWVFVNTFNGTACVTAPIRLASLPPAGTINVAGSLNVGTSKLPIKFTLRY